MNLTKIFIMALLYGFASICMGVTAPTAVDNQLAQSNRLSANPMEGSQKVFQLLNARLKYMQVVAAFKYRNHVPVTVPIQERVMTNAVVTAALPLRLDGQAVRAYYMILIQVGKQVQYAWIDRWDSLHSPAPSNVPEMRQIRANLLKMDSLLLQQFAKSVLVFHDPNKLSSLRKQVIKEINVTYVSDADKLRLLQALINIKTLP